MMIYLVSYMLLLVCMNPPCITAGNLTKGLNIGNKDQNILKDIVKTGGTCQCGVKGRQRQRIVGGTAVLPGEWPWIVVLSIGETDGSNQVNAECAGTLVASQWILTAAHCLYNTLKVDKYETTDFGKLCSSSLGQESINKEIQCRQAATLLGRPFRGTVSHDGRAYGCYYAFAGRRPVVYFNTSPNPGTTVNGRSICSRGKYQQVIFPHMMSAVIGEHKIKTTDDEYDTKRKNLEIERIVVHPKYDLPYEQQNDIALLKLKEKVDLSVYMPACLLPGEKDWSSNYGWVYGWGDIYDGSGRPTNTMRETYLRIITNDNCNGRTGFYDGKEVTMVIDPDMMCADGIRSRRDACNGDSGGPLTVAMNNKHYLVGINSWGIGCGTPNLPAVFANVSYQRKWIDETVNVNGGADFCSGLN